MSELPRAGDVARRDAPTCHLDERLGDVRRKVDAVGWDVCVVVNGERVVLGLLRAEQLAKSDESRIEDVMRPGPSTFRPHVPINEMAEHMREHNLERVPITTSDGRLVGVLWREDAERAVHEMHKHHDHGDGDGDAE
ncbi:MAG TPA: CBS domain-containing protein [Actinomycetota bacterium]|jgi:CBS domain-containing protein